MTVPKIIHFLSPLASSLFDIDIPFVHSWLEIKYFNWTKCWLWSYL